MARAPLSVSRKRNSGYTISRIPTITPLSGKACLAPCVKKRSPPENQQSQGTYHHTSRKFPWQPFQPTQIQSQIVLRTQRSNRLSNPSRRGHSQTILTQPLSRSPQKSPGSCQLSIRPTFMKAPTILHLPARTLKRGTNGRTRAAQISRGYRRWPSPGA